MPCEWDCNLHASVLSSLPWRDYTPGKRCVCFCPILNSHFPPWGDFARPKFMSLGVFQGEEIVQGQMGLLGVRQTLLEVLFLQAPSPLHNPPHFAATPSLVTQRAVCDSPCIQTLQHHPSAGDYPTVPSF